MFSVNNIHNDIVLMITLYIVSTLFLVIVDNINMLVKNIFKLKNLRFFVLIFLSACIENAPLDSLSPEGPYARSIDELFWLTFWIAVVVFVIVQGALLLHFCIQRKTR